MINEDNFKEESDNCIKEEDIDNFKVIKKK